MFLGTEPPKQSIAFTESRPLDYAAMEQERVALLAQLKAAGGAAGLDAAAAAKAEAHAGSSQAPLLLRAKVPNRLDSAELGGFGAGMGGSGMQQGSQQQRQLTVTLLLSNTTKSALQVSLSCVAGRCVCLGGV
jgi:flagellar hook-length control protein FliK